MAGQLQLYWSDKEQQLKRIRTQLLLWASHTEHATILNMSTYSVNGNHRFSCAAFFIVT